MALRWEDTIVRVAPPWLQRSQGGRVLRAIGRTIDYVNDRIVQGVALRFPTDVVDAGALTRIGRERRIRRGPAESAVTYARRLRPWWDAHRLRGGPYALLRQMRAYFSGLFNVKIDVLAYSGRRVTVDRDDTFTRDIVTWEADGTGKWARIWIFLWFADEILTSTDETLVDQDGNTLLFSLAEPADLEVVRAIPREWNAAHVQLTTIVLLAGVRRLWNYPQPVPTWAAWGASGATWGDAPTITTIEA